MNTWMSELPMRDLLREYGSPLWLYHAETMHRRVECLQAFDVIRYAQKACSNLHVLRLMQQWGVKVDAVSLGEIERAMRAGFALTPSQGVAEVVYTADIFDRMTLEHVVTHQVEVNIGSIDMLHQLGALSPGHRVWLRVNPGFGHGHSQKTNTGGENSKHGIWHAELADAVRWVRHYRFHLVGLHMHIGSGVDYGHLQRVCEAMIMLLNQIDHDIEAISAGGGLSIPYRHTDQEIDPAHYFMLWDQVRQHAQSLFGHPVRLEIEPGRFLVADAGVLLAEVRACKHMGSKHFTLVDAGFSDLVRPTLYNSHHEISVLAGDGRDVLAALPRSTVVAGPLCESGDVFTQGPGGVVESRLLPPAQVGDYLVFHDAGAYGASMSSNYNSRLLAAECLWQDGGARLIRRRQTFDDLLQLECCTHA